MGIQIPLFKSQIQLNTGLFQFSNCSTIFIPLWISDHCCKRLSGEYVVSGIDKPGVVTRSNKVEAPILTGALKTSHPIPGSRGLKLQMCVGTSF